MAGNQRPTNEARVREYCARIHTCARCEGNPPELRDLTQPGPRARINLGVARSADRGTYARRHLQKRKLLRDRWAIIRASDDVEALVAQFAAGALRVEQYEARGGKDAWRVTLV
jgi:hypothetical protein